MESVMWAFKQLWDKGLIYEGYRVLPYSWAAETPLSNFETRLDDRYRERQDPALTVALPARVADRASGPTEAAGPGRRRPGRCRRTSRSRSVPRSTTRSCELGERRVADRREAARERYAKELDGGTTVGHASRAPSSAACRYEPLFPFFADTENAFRVLAADFVATDEGTGIVHMAPGFGEDDLAVCREAAGIPVVVPGRRRRAASPPRSPPWAGQHVFDANPDDHPATSRSAATSCATRRSTTTTRTAGAPTRR